MLMNEGIGPIICYKEIWDRLEVTSLSLPCAFTFLQPD